MTKQQAVFKLGDNVNWSSQSRSYSKHKVGTVAEVVPAGQLPSKERWPKLYSGAGLGYPRVLASREEPAPYRRCGDSPMTKSQAKIAAGLLSDGARKALRYDNADK